MAKKIKNKRGFFSFFTDERFLFSLGIVLFLCALYVALALVSFFFTGAADQSVVLADAVSRGEMKHLVQNWTGMRGAIIAEYLVNDCFGLSTYVLLLIPFALSMRLIKVPFMKLWKAFVFPILFVIWGPVMLDFFFGRFCDATFFNIGGAYGMYMSDMLIANVGKPGTFFIILAFLIVFCVFAFSATIPAIRRVLTRREREVNPVVANDLQDSCTEPDIEDDVVVPVDSIVAPDDEEVASPTEVVVDDEPTVEPDDIIVETVEERNDDEPRVEDITEKEPVVEGKSDKDDDLDPEFDDVEVQSEDASNDDGDRKYENLPPYDPTLDLSYYKYPTLNLLKEYPQPTVTLTEEEKKANQLKIISTLKSFGIGVKKIFETIGPTITLYEIVPEDGVRISKIRNLEADIMLSLAAIGIRIIAPMPGKGTIGIEVPNSNPKIVSMFATIASKKFQESKFDLPVALGRTITNDVFMFDLTKMPHLLVAGATGQGKSVGLNAIITSLLYKKHPSQLKFVLVDPKKVEFNIYSDIERHFLAKIPDAEEPVITDVTKVVETLNSLCKEMDARYDLLKKAHTRNIKEYNEKFIARRLNPNHGHKYLPYIVVIVDEFGDLIMTAGKEVELPIARIAQLARAVGMHMILATQRPSVNIITGVIKANFPARIAFKVSSGIDSKTILDGSGAQQLVGRGDLLFSQGSEAVRVQCAFVDTPEIENIVSYISEQQGYPSAFELPEPDVAEGEADLSGVDLTKRDPLFDEVARYIVSSQMGSTSNIQRKFEIGFNRAGRIMDQMEVAGVVGPVRGSKPREVLVQSEAELDMLLSGFR